MTDPTISVGLTVTSAGAQQTPPAVLWAKLIDLVASVNAGYTVLPAGLIEDLASTGTYAISLCDAAACEAVNSLTPFGANSYVLNELGQVYGVPHGTTTNTSVYVVFTGTVGFIIANGFLVSDGTYQYQVQTGGVIKSDGTSDPIYCVATVSGSWAVAENTVTALASSIPGTITLTCTNPNAGTPSASNETEAQYAARVLQAGLVSGQGNASMCKTLLANVPGVQPRLISTKQVNGGGWEVICGGGDPYAIAYAIYQSGLDISTLSGSTIAVTGITNANPGVVTTNLNHGLTTGQANVHIAGVVGMTGVNGGPYTVTVIDEKRFSFGVDTTSAGTYTSGGVVTPNARNISVNLNDYPDSYTVPFVSPPAQTVTVQLGWSTVSPNYVSAASVQQLGATAIMNFINAIPVGSPINLYAMEQTFVAAVVSLFNNNAALISAMNWTISINGIATSPSSGTFLIYGDSESYFNVASSGITISQV